jgi:outer membrane protein assembly factor BamB
LPACPPRKSEGVGPGGARAPGGLRRQSAAAPAADWPQHLGPDRNAVSGETGLLTSWPKGGPPLLWQKKIGEGYSAPVVAGDRLVLFHRVGDKEVVECLAADTGESRWKFSYPTAYVDAYDLDYGPRSTPAIAGGRVYAFGVEGMLHCLDLATGEKVWGRSVNKDYKAPRNFFGAGTSPVVEGDLLLLNVGAKEAGIVAFDKATGKEVWKATGDAQSYSSPTVATISGRRTAVFFTREGVKLLDPRDGKVTYEKPWRARKHHSVNAATPLVIGDLLYFSTLHEIGSLLLRVTKDGAEEVWCGEEILANHYNTSIHHEGHLYGLHGWQRVVPTLRCVELKTGKVCWEQKGVSCASMIKAQGRIIAYTDKGDLLLIEPSPKGYRELGRASWGPTPCRAEIALANGLLYTRANQKLACWDLRGK